MPQLAPPCRAVLVWRVREPGAHYVSFYRWARPSHNFSAWFPRDLQTNVALHSRNADHARSFARDELVNQTKSQYFTTDADGALCRRALLVAEAVDFLWPCDADSYDALLRAISTYTGLPAMASVRKKPNSVRRYQTSWHASVTTPGTNATELSLRHAPCDWKLYRQAQRRSRLWRASREPKPVPRYGSGLQL